MTSDEEDDALGCCGGWLPLGAAWGCSGGWEPVGVLAELLLFREPLVAVVVGVLAVGVLAVTGTEGWVT